MFFISRDLLVDYSAKSIPRRYVWHPIDIIDINSIKGINTQFEPLKYFQNAEMFSSSSLLLIKESYSGDHGKEQPEQSLRSFGLRP
ncbi:MAG: hypothetical protein ACFFH0_10425, partial [Promethearchaeota archaeon]